MNREAGERLSGERLSGERSTATLGTLDVCKDPEQTRRSLGLGLPESPPCRLTDTGLERLLPQPIPPWVQHCGFEREVRPPHFHQPFKSRLDVAAYEEPGGCVLRSPS